jgi:hypothetical protein
VTTTTPLPKPRFELILRGDEAVAEAYKGLTPLEVVYFDAEEETSWLIEGYFPEKETLLLYGPSHVGKTYIALDLAFAVATGDQWLGHRVPRPRPVLYVASEGRRGLNRRVRTLVNYRLGGLTPDAYEVEFSMYDLPLDLSGKGEEARRSLDRLTQYARVTGAGLVVIDVLSDFTAGVEENSREFGHALARLRELPCAVLAVHHSGKDVSRGARGHSSVKGTVDIEVAAKVEASLVNPDGTPSRTIVTLSQEKNRNEDKAPNLSLYIAKPTPDSTAAVMGPWDIGTASGLLNLSNQAGLLPYLEAMVEIPSAQPGATEAGCSTQEVADAVGNSRQAADKALKTAVDLGLCVLHKEAGRHLWKLTPKGLSLTEQP